MNQQCLEQSLKIGDDDDDDDVLACSTHIVDDARFVSSCFSLPSRARPRLSLLFVSRGVR